MPAPRRSSRGSCRRSGDQEAVRDAPEGAVPHRREAGRGYHRRMPPLSVFERSVEIDAPADRVFRFHLDTRNAPLISPPGARFVAIEGEFPVRVGSVVTLRVRQRPIPFAQRWRVRIAEIDEGRLVVDVAERSPFARWRHEHRFEEVRPGVTRMTDHVEYALPLGPLGRLADRLAGRRALERMFAVRHERTRRLFASGDAPA